MNQKLSYNLKKSPADINCVYPDLAYFVKTWKVAGTDLTGQTKISECFKIHPTSQHCPMLDIAKGNTADKPMHKMQHLE